MKTFNFIFTLIICCIGIGILFYLANYGLSTQSVPSLQEYMASTTQESSQATSSDISGTLVSTSSDALSSSTSPNYPLLTSSSSSLSSSYSILRAPNFDFRIQTAKNTESRTRGLSGRESLASDEGLLFIFPKSGQHGFWMKDMNFPIDIVWIDSSKKVAGITENISPDSFPDTFLPPKSIQFVLEVNAGAARNSGLATGTILAF